MSSAATRLSFDPDEESDFHRLYDAVTAQLEHERDAAETGAERALVMRLYAAVWDATRNMKESPNV